MFKCSADITEEIQMNTEAHDTVFYQTQQKFRKHGSLGVTAEDHYVLGSTPEPLLQQNPGKTLLEIFDDDQILAFLEEMDEILLAPGHSEGWYSYRQAVYDDYLRSLVFLNEQKRLPEKFRQHLEEMNLA